MIETAVPASARARTRPGAGSNAKRAARLADRIIDDIINAGWPVGEVLGSEGELLERYQVSRAIFREAVRLVEHLEVARTRRGPGGGLVVAEPSVEAVIEAVVFYIYRIDARLDEVFEARSTIEGLAGELAARRLSERDLIRLRAFVSGEDPAMAGDLRALHSLVAASTRNSAIQLFVDVLSRVARLYSSSWKGVSGAAAEASAHAHVRIAEAVIAGDAAAAGDRMRKHLAAEAAYLRRRRSTMQILPPAQLAGSAPNGKLAEAVARSVAAQMISLDLHPGDLIGSEAELIEQQGVSRAVFREAVRLLEYHQVAQMRRGPGGGLFVMPPSSTAVTEIVAIYLARQGMRLAELSELRTGLEAAIVAFAVERAGPADVEHMREALVREANSTEEERGEAVHDLHAAIAAASHSRVLELVALVLIRLSRLYQIEKLAGREREKVREEVLRTHHGIAQAIIDRDLDLARHRMQRHLAAVEAFIT